jgi:cytochrome c oxidase subunit 2
VPTHDDAEQSRPRISWSELLWTWVILTAVTIAGSLIIIPWLMPHAASSTMHMVILTMLVFSVAAAPVGSLVYAVALYALRHWRHSTGDEPPPDGPPLRGNTWITIVWISTSAVLCMFLLIWGLAAMAADDAVASRSTLTVDVTAQQWLWTFHYPGTKVTSNELVLPEGRTVTFDVSSLDVVHGFWIVQMGVKIDANPFQVTTVSVTPDETGTFTIICSELCGLDHAFMTAKLHVVTPSQYKSWLAAQPQ